MDPLRIAIGAVTGTIGGPATYARELVDALVHAFPADTYTVLTDNPEAFPNAHRVVHVPLRSAWGQPIWDQVSVARALRKAPVDLYHGTKGVLPRVLSLPAVVTIHDLANYVMPETFRWAQRIHLRVETPSTVRRAKRIVTDSRSSAADLARLFPSVRDRIVVVPLAAPSWIRRRDTADVSRWKTERGLGGPVVGYLGTLQPRKNVDLLARAFLRAAGDREWTLLLAGRLRPGYRPACLDVRDPRIRYLGPLADEEVSLFLASLTCMVSPSAYEGFGLSLLEAMTIGCPVIAVSNSSVPELVGDAGVLIPRPELDALAAAIESIVTDASLAAELGQRALERSAAYSWRETARRTREVYAAAADR